MQAQHQEQADMVRSLYSLFTSSPWLPIEAWNRARLLEPSDNPFMCLVSSPPQMVQGAQSQSQTQTELRQLLLSKLDYDKRASRDDVMENYNIAATSPLIEQDKSINGHWDGCLLRSPLSFVCARLAHTLDIHREKTAEKKDQVAAIRVFCGEHMDMHDRMNNAAGIVDNLTAQLLSSFKNVDLMKAIERGGFGNNGVRYAFWRFKHALQLLPATAVVFCIIDNLPLYLADERIADAVRTLLQRLIQLTHRHRKSATSCTFKLLLTAPGQLHDPAADILEEGEVFDVPETIPETGGFTDLQWEAAVGRGDKLTLHSSAEGW
ncbi:hypothetical protein BO71DRAFT_405085 [Aspergillus ellipticus CBS 707.79]|uniref:Uncharacterized protein n=1 Tax=Aspergillus ellipticus CBS 707.79 TaxID=1448320 RepID=A0A319DQA6_9EURO|nr:hypothetical protein BO71DRAFT_405085 [Aspergillus ellipticus CBS 707.79]